ncbi:MAG: tRNA dihydrouridine synthase DusB [Candidatus Omnitrophota bacterium]
MIKLGKLKLKSNIILAPLAGISDLPFRMLNRSFGAELGFIEMLNCRAISYKSRRTKSMLASTDGDRPLGVQLLGCEEKYILKALDILAPYAFDVIDFNAACPARKVVRRCEGAALLKEPKKLRKLLSLIVKNTERPVTVKIRTGWDTSSVNAVNVARLAEDAGIKGIFIHGRTKLEEYSGEIDYATIKQVKRAVSIPVIASGNILSAILAKKMFDDTGCDGITVARGSLGNPWIFKEIAAVMKDGRMIEHPSLKEIISVMLKHLEANIAFYGERRGVLLFRKFFSSYTKGLRNIRPLREKASRVKTKKEVEGLINALH